MQKLLDGVHRFANDEFGMHRELFQRLAEQGQRPHALFITCADSRVVAELITHSRPGDLFVVKNAGNIVPPAHVTGDTNSTAAAIEFALEQLQVEDVVVCGHSQCGAMKALIEGLPSEPPMPHLAAWLEVAAPVRRVVCERYHHLTDQQARCTAAELENVLFALENLRTYPCVQRGLANGRLRLHGWFFKISTAELFAYEPATQQFTSLIGSNLDKSGDAGSDSLGGLP